MLSRSKKSPSILFCLNKWKNIHQARNTDKNTQGPFLKQTKPLRNHFGTYGVNTKECVGMIRASQPESGHDTEKNTVECECPQ